VLSITVKFWLIHVSNLFFFLSFVFEDVRILVEELFYPRSQYYGKKFLYQNHLLLYISNENLSCKSRHWSCSRYLMHQLPKKKKHRTHQTLYYTILDPVKFSTLHFWMMNTVDQLCCNLHFWPSWVDFCLPVLEDHSQFLYIYIYMIFN
jgi:hypothetical protein